MEMGRRKRSGFESTPMDGYSTLYVTIRSIKELASIRKAER